MGRAKGKTSAEWSRLISEQRSSGETQKAWCTARGISLRTFRDWAYMLKREEAGTAVDWLELENQDALPGRCPPPSGFIEIFIGPCTVRVTPGFDRALFADVCKSLGELC
jgi:hypothetical protein